MINYGFSKVVDQPFEATVTVVTDALKKEGFGILTTIDVKAKLKEKLDVDLDQYVILGACNPVNAYKAILAEQDIGLMLPCNVIVYEKGGKTMVSIIKPTAVMGALGNSALSTVAETVETSLRNVFEAI